MNKHENHDLYWTDEDLYICGTCDEVIGFLCQHCIGMGVYEDNDCPTCQGAGWFEYDADESYEELADE